MVSMRFATRASLALWVLLADAVRVDEDVTQAFAEVEREEADAEGDAVERKDYEDDSEEALGLAETGENQMLEGEEAIPAEQLNAMCEASVVKGFIRAKRRFRKNKCDCGSGYYVSCDGSREELANCASKSRYYNYQAYNHQGCSCAFCPTKAVCHTVEGGLRRNVSGWKKFWSGDCTCPEGMTVSGDSVKCKGTQKSSGKLYRSKDLAGKGCACTVATTTAAPAGASGDEIVSKNMSTAAGGDVADDEVANMESNTTSTSSTDYIRDFLSANGQYVGFGAMGLCLFLCVVMAVRRRATAGDDSDTDSSEQASGPSR